MNECINAHCMKLEVYNIVDTVNEAVQYRNDQCM